MVVLFERLGKLDIYRSSKSDRGFSSLNTRQGLSVQCSGLDIDDIPMTQIEKRYQFWCKNGGKWQLCRWLIFARNKHPTFHGSPKEHATQKVAREKGPRQKEKKGATNKIEKR